MGTQAEPEITENQPDTTNHTDNPPESNSPSPQPVTSPVDNSIREVMSAYQEELRLSAQRNRELEERLNRAEAPPARTPEEESQEFFANPKKSMRDEISNAVKPLNEFVAAQARSNLISQIKDNMRRGQGFDHLDKVEAIMDQYLAQYNVIDVNSAVASYNAAVGRFVSLNGVNALAPQNETTQTNTRTPEPVNNNPPHVRPSPPPVNRTNASDKAFKLPRPLNENEKKMARFNKMSDEDWWIETYEKKPQDIVPKTESGRAK